MGNVRALAAKSRRAVVVVKCRIRKLAGPMSASLLQDMVCVVPSLAAPRRLHGEAPWSASQSLRSHPVNTALTAGGLHGVPVHDKMSAEYVIDGGIGYNA